MVFAKGFSSNAFLSLIIAFNLLPATLYPQQLTQTIKGKILERDTQYPLTGATIILVSDTVHFTGTTSDPEGDFRLEKVPVGRQRLKISFVGYRDVITNVEVSSAKEVILAILLDAMATQLSEIVVRSSNDGEASNEMAPVSARSFTIEETQRYAGSRGDPARMASNFAGVQGADDSRNDIVIRGNSPQGVLWRMEGINIPNPNHFNIPGTAGGPVSMINNKTLANSDFFTGAFPAEYGNSISGVFDLKLRNGNNEKHEVSGQFGFLGTEIFAEGPLSRKNKSSYLISYRYSTLAIFNKLGIDIGTNAIPQYQDVGFKFNFPLKNRSAISVFGLGGKSSIDILISKQTKPDRNIYGENDRDQYFKTQAGLLGVSYKYPINPSNFMSATVALSGEMVDAYDDLVYRHLDGNNNYQVDSLRSILDYNFKQNKVSGSLFFSKKMEKAGTFNYGVNGDVYFFQFRDSVRNIQTGSPGYYTWRTRWNNNDQSVLLQPFIQWKYAFSEKTDILLGLHSQYFSLSQSFVPVEPRAGFKWKMNERQSFNVGIGMHSQVQPTYLYFYGQTNDIRGQPVSQNRKMGFTRSVHYVGSYEQLLGSSVRLKGEIYYQYLYGVPVDNTPSSFSVLNTGSGFSRFFPGKLVNEGTGKNYGVELTVEKSLTRGYLFLVTGSLFEAKYHGSDKIWRDTDFNGNYVFNTLISKEWFVKGRNTISIGGKVTTAGGRRYGPVDAVRSSDERDVIYVDATRNSLQFRPYFRADLRISYKVNRPKVTHEIAVDLVNIFGTKNILKLTYSPNDLLPGSNPVREEYQLGFLPLFYYRMDFKLK